MKQETEKPNIITGGSFTDARGTLSFINNFDLLPARRFYIIEHPDVSVVRAWQGHKREQKWFYVIAGSFKMVIVKPADWVVPGEEQYLREFRLHAGDNKLLHVPGGYASGFKASEPGSKLLVFSEFAVADAASDEFRFDKDLWYDWQE